MKILRNKEYEDLLQYKGYYDNNNQDNEYLKAIASQLRGIKLPMSAQLSAGDIRKAYETCGPVKGVIDYIADNVGDVMRYLELRRQKPDGTYEYFDDHWLMDILRHPNDRYNLRRFGKAWAVNRLLFDYVFVYAPLTVGKDRRIDPNVGMHVIPGDKVSVEEMGLEDPIHGVKITLGNNRTIEADGNIFESFGYSLDPASPFGTSNIATAAVYLSIMDKGMRRQDTALDNGGIAGIITPKSDGYGVKPSEADSVEQEFNDVKNLNRIKAMRMPVDYHPVGSNPVDLNILGAHKEAVNVLCFLYRLPIDLYYGQSKYENMKEAKKAIYEQQAIPLAEEFGADIISYCGLDREGMELVVNTDRVSVLQESSTDALSRAAAMHASLNEMRSINGYGPVDEPYADKPMLPMGIQFGYEAYDINELQ